MSAGAMLRQLRQSARLTLEQTAAQADTTAAYLADVEAGACLPSRDYAARVSETITGYMLRNAEVST